MKSNIQIREGFKQRKPITNKLFQEKFLELKDMSCQVERTYQIPRTIDKSRPTPRHVRQEF